MVGSSLNPLYPMTVKDATKTKKLGPVVQSIRRMYAKGLKTKDLIPHAHEMIKKYKDQP